MSHIEKNCRYTHTHEWVRRNEEASVTVGVSDYAQAQLGEVVFVELPKINASLNAGQACAVLESVKAAGDIYCPLAGKVIAVNEALISTPGLINQSSYQQGWIFKLLPNNFHDIENLLTPTEYAAQAESA